MPEPFGLRRDGAATRRRAGELGGDGQARVRVQECGVLAQPCAFTWIRGDVQDVAHQQALDVDIQLRLLSYARITYYITK